MASREISWQNAFLSLPPLAINSMMQPWGRVCGFDPSLRTYLRSSPIVCAFDAVTIIIRFVAYSCVGLSGPVAAKKVIAARRGDDDDTERGGIRSLEQVLFVRCVVLAFGVLPQVIKLMACSGLPWTKVWGCFYLVSFIVVEVMKILAMFAVEELDSAGDDPLEHWMALCEKVCGAAAVLLQLALLAWVDLAVIPPDPNLIHKLAFHLFRLSAHFVVFLIHIPLMAVVAALQSDPPTPISNRRLGAFIMSILATYILLAGVERFRFSQLYIVWSIIISAFAWVLYFFPVARTHVLLCEPGNRGHRNVVAFDFFCRILFFSLFWYAKHYDPTGTSQPEWAGHLG